MFNCPTNSPGLPVGDSAIPYPHRLAAYLLFGFSHIFLGSLSTLNLPNRNVIYPSCHFLMRGAPGSSQQFQEEKLRFSRIRVEEPPNPGSIPSSQGCNTDLGAPLPMLHPLSPVFKDLGFFFYKSRQTVCFYSSTDSDVRRSDREMEPITLFITRG